MFEPAETPEGLSGRGDTVIVPAETDGGLATRPELLLRALPAPLLLLDGDGRVSASNPAADRLFGAEPPESVVGRRFVAGLDPESAARFEWALDRIQKSPSGDPGFDQLLLGLGPSERRFQLDITVTNVGTTAPALLVLLRSPSDPDTAHPETTDRESVLAAAVEAAQLGVWHHDLATDRMLWGGHYREVLMSMPGSFDGTFRGLLGTVHPDDRDQLSAAIEGARDAGGHYASEFRITGPDGRVRWVHVWGRFLLGPDGRAARSVGAFRDVTEQKGLERQLTQAQKIEAIGQLAAGIAHEINTPTQYVSDNLRFLGEAFEGGVRMLELYQALRDELEAGGLAGEQVAAIRALEDEIDYPYLIAEVPQAMRQALEGVERVTTILRAVKSFSHPGATRKDPVDLNEVVANTLTVSRNEWKYIADARTDLDPTLPPVPCLRSEIQQVVLNLVINAAHAIGEAEAAREGGKGSIVVSTRRVDDWVELSVSDTGTGIPDAIQARIFDPFFTTKVVGKGTGQGLALVHNVVVDKHGGTVWFDTTPGRGTRFVVRLPLTDPGVAEPTR